VGGLGQLQILLVLWHCLLVGLQPELGGRSPVARSLLVPTDEQVAIECKCLPIQYCIALASSQLWEVSGVMVVQVDAPWVSCSSCHIVAMHQQKPQALEWLTGKCGWWLLAAWTH